MTERRRPLTVRLLRGMYASLAAHSAGGPEDMTGQDDAQSRALHAAACDALAWVSEELQRRGKSIDPPVKRERIHVASPTDRSMTMCGRERVRVAFSVAWSDSRAVVHAAMLDAPCKACVLAYDAERQRVHDEENRMQSPTEDA